MVELRDWHIEDAFVFHELSMNAYFHKQRLKQFLYPDTFLNTVTILETYRNADKTKFCIQAIVQNQTVCGFMQFERKDLYSGELSYWVGQPYWNQHIATQAIQEMCKKVFQNFSILCIYARVKEDNIASQKALDHNKFKCVHRDNNILIYELYK